MTDQKPGGAASREMKHHRLNGSTVAALREARGVSQAELARLCEISASYLSQLESGRRQPSPSVARLLAEHLGTAFSEITEPVKAAS
jgi:transcriptional regulator with XRE-family HTH domain